MPYPEYPLLPTGWASYIDTQYPNSGAAFSVAANTDTLLPNNAGTVIDNQKPYHVTSFYTAGKITGRTGDSLDVQIFFKAIPSQNSQYIDVWIDVGGSIGRIYEQTFSFFKGAGTQVGAMFAIPSGYTLDTWETNGGTVYVRSNHPLIIHSIVYNFDRSHKAR